MAGLGLSELVPDESCNKTDMPPSVNETGELINEDQRNEMPQQQPIIPKKVGFAIPKLNITGLGLSEIIPEKQAEVSNEQKEERKQSERDQDKEKSSMPVP